MSDQKSTRDRLIGPLGMSAAGPISKAPHITLGQLAPYPSSSSSETEEAGPVQHPVELLGSAALQEPSSCVDSGLCVPAAESTSITYASIAASTLGQGQNLPVASSAIGGVAQEIAAYLLAPKTISARPGYDVSAGRLNCDEISIHGMSSQSTVRQSTIQPPSSLSTLSPLASGSQHVMDDPRAEKCRLGTQAQGCMSGVSFQESHNEPFTQSPPPPPPRARPPAQPKPPQQFRSNNSAQMQPLYQCPDHVALPQHVMGQVEQQRLWQQQQQQQQQQQKKKEQDPSDVLSAGFRGALSSHALNNPEDHSSMSDIDYERHVNANDVSKSTKEATTSGGFLTWWSHMTSPASGPGPNKGKRGQSSLTEEAKQQLQSAYGTIQQLEIQLKQKIKECEHSNSECVAIGRAAKASKADFERAISTQRQQLGEAANKFQSLMAECTSQRHKLAQSASTAQAQRDSLARKDAKIRELEADVEGMQEQLGTARSECSNTDFLLQDYIARLHAAEERIKQLEQSTPAPVIDAHRVAETQVPSTSAGTNSSPQGGDALVGQGAASLNACSSAPSVLQISPPGLSLASGGSKEAALLRGVLLRFDHHSFELGLGPQQIKSLLELVNRDVQELADAVIGSMKSPVASSKSSSSISEDYEMPNSGEDNQNEQSPSCTMDSTYLRRLQVNSQIMQLVYVDLMVRPLAAFAHDLHAVESASQVADGSETSLLASLLRSNTCRHVYNLVCKAQDGKNKRFNNSIKAISHEFSCKVASFFQCPGVQSDMVVVRALLLGCMVPAAHPSLRLFFTATSPESGGLQPFNAAAHRQVHEIPGLEASHPAARAVLYSLLPGVGFVGEDDRIICERVVTKAKDPCPA